MANLDAQIAADLLSMFRVENGFGSTALLGAAGDRSVPVTTGTAVIGIFDDGTAEGGERGGARWWCRATDGYDTGRLLTVTGQGTYMIAAVGPRDDGKLYEALLEQMPVALSVT